MPYVYPPEWTLLSVCQRRHVRYILVICVAQDGGYVFFYNCASRSTWTFSFLFTSSSSIMWVPRRGFYTVTRCLLLFSLLAFVSVLSAILQPSPTPTQLYVCDALYRHLVHIEDCHCHLLIITVTCTLRSAINT